LPLRRLATNNSQASRTGASFREKLYNVASTHDAFFVLNSRESRMNINEPEAKFEPMPQNPSHQNQESFDGVFPQISMLQHRSYQRIQMLALESSEPLR